MEPTDTVPVEGDENDPEPGDVGVADVGGTDRPSDSARDPPEPSPEEIAFGSSPGDPDRESGRGTRDDTGSGDRTATDTESGDRSVTNTESGDDTGSTERTVTEREDWFDADTEEDSATETTEREGTGGFEPAGSTAPSDPLADPNESE